MIYTLIFIAGICFASLAQPLIDLCVQSIQSRCEVRVSKNNLSISRNNVRIEQLGKSCECDTVQAIGFSIDSSDEYDDEDEDDDDDDECRGGRK